MVGLMPTSRTRLDSSFHNIAKQSRLATYVFEWVPLWTAHTFCCVSVCRNHWWTVNELIMSEYFHGMFTSCIDFTITLKRISFYICGLERMLCFVEKSYIITTVHTGWLKWSLVWITAPMNAEQPYGMEHHAAYMAQGAYDPYGYSQKTNFMVHQGIKSKSELLTRASKVEPF